MRWWVVSLVLMGAAAAHADEGAATAYRGATLETLGPAGRIEDGILVVRGGKIVAAGQTVPIPEDARVVDVRGQTLLPGIVEPFREIAVAGGTTDAAPRTIVFRGRVIQLPAMAGGPTGFTRVADNFVPYDPSFRPLPRFGITHVNLVTDGTGQAAVAKLLPDPSENLLLEPNGVAYATVTNQSESIDQIRSRLELISRMRQGGGGGGFPGGGFPGGGMGGPPGGRPGGGMDALGSMARNQTLWVNVHDGKTPLLIEAANSAAILHVVKLLAPYKQLKIVLLANGEDLYEAIPALKGTTVRVLVRPDFVLKPGSRDRLNVARALHEAGVEFAFTRASGGGGAADPLAALGLATPRRGPSTEPPANADFPFFAIAMGVKTGLPRQVALEALCKRPAAFLGLESHLGTLEPGKSATMLFFAGDPLDPQSQLRQVMIDGRMTHAY